MNVILGVEATSEEIMKFLIMLLGLFFVYVILVTIVIVKTTRRGC